MPAEWGLGEKPFWLADGLLLLMLSRGGDREQAEEASSLLSLSVGALVPQEGPTLMTYSPPKGATSSSYPSGDEGFQKDSAETRAFSP